MKCLLVLLAFLQSAAPFHDQRAQNTRVQTILYLLVEYPNLSGSKTTLKAKKPAVGNNNERFHAYSQFCVWMTVLCCAKEWQRS